MGLKAALTSLFYIVKLSLQSLSLILKARYRHCRAKAAFKKTLISEGISQETAKELTQVYPNPITEMLSLLNLRKLRGNE